jgi:hypothetical protein
MKTSSRLRTRIAALIVALALPAAASAAEPDVAALKGEAAGIIKTFAGSLQGELKAAMERGGPVEAIQVCAAKAVPLADQASADSGWSVGRSSHKLRNPKNAPDALELQVLSDFLNRQAKGEKADDLVYAAVVDSAEGKEFRFIKAIPTGEPCLACHGTAIKPEVAKELDALYPADQARGFSAGDMRGIFTLSRKL